MARVTAASLVAKNPVYEAILRGDFDGEGLEDLEHAVSIRRKTMFRPGTKVRLVGTRNPELEGREGVIVKVNPKRITVGLGERDAFGYEDEVLAPSRMLEVVQA